MYSVYTYVPMYTRRYTYVVCTQVGTYVYSIQVRYTYVYTEVPMYTRRYLCLYT